MDYNPSTPVQRGVELRPAVQVAVDDVTADADAVGLLIESTATETIDTAHVYVDPLIATGPVVVEVYEVGDEIAGATTTTYYYPNADGISTGGGTVSAETLGGVPYFGAGYFAELDEDPPDNYGGGGGAGAGSEKRGRVAIGSADGNAYSVELGSGAFPLTDRVVNLVIGIVGLQSGVAYRLYLEDAPGTTTHQIGEVTATGFAAGVPSGVGIGAPQFSHEVFVGELNPFTGQPWTAADIRAFDAGTYKVKAAKAGPVAEYLYLDQLRLKVVHCAENRQAVAAVTPAATGWLSIPLYQPDGTDNWPKVAATDYLLTLRRPIVEGLVVSPLARFGLRRLRGAMPPGLTPNTYPSVTRQPSDARLATLGAAVAGDTFAWYLRTTAPATSVDSQSYAELAAVPVNVGHTAATEFVGAVELYGAVVVEVRSDTLGPPEADLVLEIRRRSDNVLMGTATLAPADLLDQPFVDQTLSGFWRVATVQVAVPVTLAAVQYAIVATSTARDGAGWRVARLGTLSADAATASFGGTSDVATVDGVDDSTSDLVMAVATAPDPPASISVTVQTTPTGQPANAACRVDTIDWLRVSWPATALGGEFLRYEVERFDDGAWHRTHHVGDEATTDADDHEVRIGVDDVLYRVRVMRTDLVASAWTTLAVGVDLDGGGGELWFTSNERPDLNVAYVPLFAPGEAVHEFDRLDAAALVVQEIYGRDGAIEFRPTEQRGVTFSRLLNVSALVAPTEWGLPVYDALVALVEDAQIPYVCVRDSHGGRWLASVNVPKVRQREPSHVYLADVTIRDLTFTPAVVEV